MGFLRGILAGTVVSGLGLSVASLIAPQPAGNQPPVAPQTQVTEPDTADQPADSASTEVVSTGPSDLIVVERPAQPEAADPEIKADAEEAPAEQTTQSDDGSDDSYDAGKDGAEAVAASEAEIDGKEAADTADKDSADAEDKTAMADQAAVAPKPVTQGSEAAATSDSSASTAEQNDSASDDSAATAMADKEDAAETPGAAASTGPAPNMDAVKSFAARFRPDGKPLLSVVMIDSTEMGLDVRSLKELNIPITVAIRPTEQGASARGAAYRSAGFEVLMMPDLPEGVSVNDVGLAMELGFLALPQSIGILDLGTGGVGADPARLEAALARLGKDGRAFVSPDRGLEDATGAGLAAIGIARDLDDSGQSASMMRRELDDAAADARDAGAVVVLTRLLPETVSALNLWSLADQSRTIQFAPLSAQLLQE